MLRIISIFLISFIPIVSFSQTDHSSQLHIWESKFSEQEFTADHGMIITFVKPCVLTKHQIAIVPLIDLRKK